MASDGVALGAAALAEVDSGPGLLIAFDGDFKGRGDESADVGHHLPQLAIRKVGGRHVGAGEAELDGVEEHFVSRAGDGSAGHEIGAATSFAGQAVAAGAGGHEDLTTRGHVLCFEGGALGGGG